MSVREISASLFPCLTALNFFVGTLLGVFVESFEDMVFFYVVGTEN